MTIEITADGSATLRSEKHGDTYHSLRGAVGEARHVFIDSGFKNFSGGGMNTTASDTVNILEVGFGTGLNAWLTLLEAGDSGRSVSYTAVEPHPVPRHIAEALGYTEDPRFSAMHGAPWGQWKEIAPGFRLLKLHSGLAEVLAEVPAEVPAESGTKTDRGTDENFDLIYFDAFAPDTQPELWTSDVFSLIFALTAPGGVLVTYSAKGDVRRALQAAGFTVERLPGALGKRHMSRARK